MERGAKGVFVLIVMAAGCAGFTHGIRPSDGYDRSSAYLYGRFYIDAERDALAMAGHESVGFEIICRDGSKYTIGFSDREPLQVIKVVPSKCQLDYVLYTDSDGVVRVRSMATFRLLRNELLDPGGVYYVGDFIAGARTTSTFKVFYTEARTGWAFGKVQGRYGATTDEMKRAFPLLAPIPTEDRMTR